MAERPGVFSRLFTLIFQSVRPKCERIVVGKDHLGNIYYVENPLMDRAKSVNRGYIPGDRVNWDNVPPEWESWLKNRRKEAPSQEEIDFNNQQMLLVKDKAAKLDEQARAQKLAIKDEEVQPRAQPIDKPDFSKLPQVRSDTPSEASPFPSYSEYEYFPGQKYKGPTPLKKDDIKHNG